MDDLISRKEAIELAQKQLKSIEAYYKSAPAKEVAGEELSYLISELEHLPSAERQGYWKEEELIFGEIDYVCSICSETWTLEVGTPLENNMNYCPNCGAHMMDGKEEDYE